MNWFGFRLPTDETTRTAWVIRIRFEKFTLKYRLFNLFNIQIIFEPLLLSMNTDFVATLSNQRQETLLSERWPSSGLVIEHQVKLQLLPAGYLGAPSLRLVAHSRAGGTVPRPTH